MSGGILISARRFFSDSVHDKRGCYFSFDVEARGPSSIRNGINGIGIVVFDEDGTVVHSYGTGISMDSSESFDANTWSEFWAKEPAALAWTQTNPKEPATVAAEIVSLYAEARVVFGKVTWIGWPAGYDWARMTGFLDKFLRAGDPEVVGFKPTCISSMAEPLQWAHALPAKPTLASLGVVNEQAHNPVSDALAQGLAYFKIRELLKQPPPKIDSTTSETNQI